MNLNQLPLKLALSGFFAMGALAQSAEVSPLLRVQDRVKLAVAQNKTPIVIFDLDDTLINTRERNLRIIRDFTAQEEILAQYPVESNLLSNLKVSEIQYLLKETLSLKGITGQSFVDKAQSFWLERFFTNEYSAEDIAQKGAAKYLKELKKSGATIVYLTGRDEPRMGVGTISNLKKLHFPLNNVQQNEVATAILKMKPTKEMDDLEFKLSAFDEIAALGEVVGIFENEPVNINAMADRFPLAHAVFLDTVHSPKHILPYIEIPSVKNFLISKPNLVDHTISATWGEILEAIDATDNETIKVVLPYSLEMHPRAEITAESLIYDSCKVLGKSVKDGYVSFYFQMGETIADSGWNGCTAKIYNGVRSPQQNNKQVRIDFGYYIDD